MIIFIIFLTMKTFNKFMQELKYNVKLYFINYFDPLKSEHIDSTHNGIEYMYIDSNDELCEFFRYNIRIIMLFRHTLEITEDKFKNIGSIPRLTIKTNQIKIDKGSDDSTDMYPEIIISGVCVPKQFVRDVIVERCMCKYQIKKDVYSEVCEYLENNTYKYKRAYAIIREMYIKKSNLSLVQEGVLGKCILMFLIENNRNLSVDTINSLL